MSKPGSKSKFCDMILRFRDWAEALLFPEGVTCLSCGCAPQKELENGLCESCVAALNALAEKQSRSEEHDSRCIPDELIYVHAAFMYQDPAKKLIRMLKYDHIQSAALPLIEAMTLLPSGEETVIVPVPTTAKREKERGFNQSVLLARGIGKKLGMRVDHVLVRDGEQQEQAMLSGTKRLKNLTGCMRAVHRMDGEKVLLVDDVYTSGATAKEAARALLAAGAESVAVFAAARSIPEEEKPEFLRIDEMI
ncbi:MAG: ComF family protein [Clostridia bacterium]|nr:ComF family protein [Clostridia bacterium]